VDNYAAVTLQIYFSISVPKIIGLTKLLQKWKGAIFFAPQCSFHTKWYGSIPTGTLLMGAECRGLWKKRDFRSISRFI